MPREERAQAAKHFFDPESKTNSLLKNAAFAAIAKARNSREASIRKGTPEQLQNWLSANVLIPDEIADNLIRLYLLHNQLPMIEAFLDDLHVPHVHGLIEESFDTGTLTEEQLTAAASRLTETYGPEATSLYFVYTAGNTGDWAEAVRKIPLA
jgi:hypothetical protein